MARKRFTKVGVNTKLIMDVAFASIIVQKAPSLIDMLFPIPESLKTVAGVGAAYLVGSMVKRPDLANAGIALGVIDFVSPMIDGLIGGGDPTVNPVVNALPTQGTIPVLPPPGITGISVQGDPSRVADYIRLNGYVSDPATRMNYEAYAGSYQNN